MFCTSSWPPGSNPDFDNFSSFYDKGGVWSWWRYCPTCPLINDCLTLLILLVRWRKLQRAELSDLSPSPLTWDSTSDQLVRHETTLLINFPRLNFCGKISTVDGTTAGWKLLKDVVRLKIYIRDQIQNFWDGKIAQNYFPGFEQELCLHKYHCQSIMNSKSCILYQ